MTCYSLLFRRSHSDNPGVLFRVPGARSIGIHIALGSKVFSFGRLRRGAFLTLRDYRFGLRALWTSYRRLVGLWTGIPGKSFH